MVAVSEFSKIVTVVCAASIGCSADDGGGQTPSLTYAGITGLAPMMFEGSLSIDIQTPCELDGPQNIDGDDGLCFAPVFPAQIEPRWDAGRITLDPAAAIVAVQKEGAAQLPSGPTDAFFALYEFDVTIGDAGLLAERPLTVRCGGRELEAGYALLSTGVVTAAQNAAEGVSAEEVRAHYERHAAEFSVAPAEGYARFSTRACGD